MYSVQESSEHRTNFRCFVKFEQDEEEFHAFAVIRCRNV